MAARMMAKYDSSAEADVRAWIQQVTGVSIESGPENMYRELKNGQIIVNLIAAVYDGCSSLPDRAQAFRPRIKASKMDIAFKQDGEDVAVTRANPPKTCKPHINLT